jgi:acyl-coenzyme A synthetase/AMP-(fatty) acid ligase
MLPSRNSYDKYPRQIEFVTILPLAVTDKIRRNALCERELRPHYG